MSVLIAILLVTISYQVESGGGMPISVNSSARKTIKLDVGDCFLGYSREVPLKFLIENDRDVSISDTESNCGCVAVLPHDQGFAGRGESLLATLNLTPMEKGKFERKVVFRFADPGGSQVGEGVIVDLRGEAKELIELTPPHIVISNKSKVYDYLVNLKSNSCDFDLRNAEVLNVERPFSVKLSDVSARTAQLHVKILEFNDPLFRSVAPVRIPVTLKFGERTAHIPLAFKSKVSASVIPSDVKLKPDGSFKVFVTGFDHEVVDTVRKARITHSELDFVAELDFSFTKSIIVISAKQGQFSRSDSEYLIDLPSVGGGYNRVGTFRIVD